MKVEIKCQKVNCKFISDCRQLNKLRRAIKSMIKNWDLDDDFTSDSLIRLVVKRGRPAAEALINYRFDDFSDQAFIVIRLGCQYVKTTSFQDLQDQLFDQILIDEDGDEDEIDDDDISDSGLKQACLASEDPEERLQRIAKQMTERAGLSHPVLLLENRDEPGLLGITYGQEIFVTTEALERLSDDNVAWVIGHEEGHIVRGHCKSNPPSPKPGIADKEEKISFGGLLGSLAIVAVAVGLGVYTYQSIYDSQEEAASTFGKEMARRAGFYPTRFW